MSQQTFVEKLVEIGEALGWTVQKNFGGWVTEFHSSTGAFFLYGFTLPLNPASSQAIARDKAATSVILASQNIPCVPHSVIFGAHVAEKWFGMERDALDIQLDTCIDAFGENLVLKPNLGLSGQGVTHVRTREEAKAFLQDILLQQRDYAVSPYVHNPREIRVVILQGQCLELFEKERGADWRHNLGRGATAKDVEDEQLRATCIALAQRACHALQLQLASVDIFVTEDGVQVIEVNSGVMLEKMAEDLHDGKARAKKAYTAMLLACMPS